jgi:hypothetical protein
MLSREQRTSNKTRLSEFPTEKCTLSHL